MSEFRKLDSPNRRVIIAGGGNIGKRLAQALEKTCHIKIVESNETRARAIAEDLKHAYVLLGDAADEDLLREENIENTDVFCALTNADEANIISSMLAKRLGAKTVMALINRAAYVDLVQRDIIDIAISPQQATIGSLLAHIRRGDVVKVHSLRRGAAEAIEAIAHGDRNSSQVVGRAIDEINLPPGTTIGAIVRGKDVIMVHHDTVIEPEDHVILVVTNKRHVSDVERLFQVNVTFI
jgi:trk system potassium uptake protein TrkA